MRSRRSLVALLTGLLAMAGWWTPTAADPPPSPTSDVQRRDPASCGPEVAGKKFTKVPEHFVNVYAWSGAKAELSETIDSKHRLGTGIKFGGRGWSANGTTTVESSYGNGASRPFSRNTAVSNKVNYRKYSTTCTGGGVTTITWKVRPTGFFSLMPPDLDKSITTPGWTGCEVVRDGFVSKDKGSNETYEGGIDLPFMNLSAHVGFSTNMMIRWKIKEKSLFCGSSERGPVASPQALVRKYVSGVQPCRPAAHATGFAEGLRRPC